MSTLLSMGDHLSDISEGIRKVEESEVASVRGVLSGRYEVISVLGTGGMGNVYLGRAKFLGGREVAIKVLHPEYSNDATLLARFVREADLLRKVRHPRVVEVFEAASVSGITFYSMELVSGTSLERVIRENNFPVNKIPDIALKILDALNAIHTLGIIHRDLKPGNIMVTEQGDIKLTDFGIARPENSQLTHHNEIVGSVCYIAPEIWIGEDPTSKVDLYSLGVVLYELATGRVPFDGASPGELMRKHLQSMPDDPSKLNPNLPLYMGKIIMKLLAKQKHERQSSALEVSESIRDNLEKKSEVKTFVAYRQDTSDFLKAVETSATGLLSVAKEQVKTPAIMNSVREKDVGGDMPVECSADLSDQLTEKSNKALVTSIIVVVFTIIGISAFLILR